MTRTAAQARPVVITTRDVALRLYERSGYVGATLPRRDPDLAEAILKAFEDRRTDSGEPMRFGDLPARKCDLAAIRQHVEMITREAERVGRSLECARYRPAFMGTVGGEQ